MCDAHLDKGNKSQRTIDSSFLLNKRQPKCIGPQSSGLRKITVLHRLTDAVRRLLLSNILPSAIIVVHRFVVSPPLV